MNVQNIYTNFLLWVLGNMKAASYLICALLMLKRTVFFDILFNASIDIYTVKNKNIKKINDVICIINWFNNS